MWPWWDFGVSVSMVKICGATGTGRGVRDQTQQLWGTWGMCKCEETDPAAMGELKKVGV